MADTTHTSPKATRNRRITLRASEVDQARELSEARGIVGAAFRHGTFIQQHIPQHLRGNPDVHTVGVLDGVDDSPNIVFVQCDIGSENGRTDGPAISLLRIVLDERGGAEGELLAFIDVAAAQALATLLAAFVAAHAGSAERHDGDARA
jgi:hypothetical protein